MRRFLLSHWRSAAGTLTLAGVLAGALIVPVPALPDDDRAAVRREVRDRLPGWRVERVDPSWEGAYTVVATCAGIELGFQFVRGHGLPADDARIQPNDAYARERLVALSDSVRFLVWRGERLRPRHLSCHDELARAGSPLVPRILD
jgi:hypothetical protein